MTPNSPAPSQPPELEFVAPVDGKDPKKKPDPNRLVGTGTEPPPKPKVEVRNEGEQVRTEERN